MNIDTSSRATDNFDDKSEFSKIDISGYDFKKLNLTSEEEMIIKKYLFYSRNADGYQHLTKDQMSLVYQLLLQPTFELYNKERALAILDHLGNDLAKKKMHEAWMVMDNIREMYKYSKV